MPGNILKNRFLAKRQCVCFKKGTKIMSDTLLDFVKDCYKAGKSHSEIRAVLLETGWAIEQVDDALSRYVNRSFPVAIPKPIVFASPRLVFLNIFYFLVLYLSIYDVVAILFTFLDYYLPDGLGRRAGIFYSSSSIGEAMRIYLATIICCVPLVWWSSRIISKAMEETKQRIPRIRLKLIYLTMFIGACVMLSNAICFIYYFLSGELGLRFIIKVAILSALTLGLFTFYRLEIVQTEIKA
jgi:hypothetical protein